MNLLQFRERVERVVEASGVPLGTYTLPESEGGGERPALNVGDPSEGTTVQGLEVVINPSPIPELLPSFAGNITLKRWQAQFINHEGAALNFEAVMDALFAEFFPAIPDYIPEAGDIAEQCRLRVLDDPNDPPDHG